MKAVPAWYRPVSWITGGLVGLVAAVAILLQWALWVVVTMQIWSPWTGLIGIAIAAAQILYLFDRPKPADSCAIPRR